MKSMNKTTYKTINLVSILLLLFVLLLSACSSEKTASHSEHKKKEPKRETVKKAPTDPEEMVANGSGEQYEKVKDLKGDALDKKLKELTKKFPKNLKSEDAYNRIVASFAADHRPAFKELEDYDITFEEVEAYEKYQEKGGDKNKEGPLNVAILLDSSGSMAAKASGTEKMAAAKEALKKFAEGLPKDVNVMLRVYGHKGSNDDKDKQLSCSSTEVVYPLGTYDAGSFGQSLSKFKPTGWTPLAASITAAEKDLQGKEGNNVVYIVSDGIETCGGDPVAAAKRLHESNIQAEVNIIGFDVDNKGQQQLKAVAEAGGGTFESVTSQKELFNEVESNWSKAMHDTRVNWASAMDITDINWSSSHKSLDMGKIYTHTVIDSIQNELSLLKDVKMNLKEQGKLSDEETLKLDKLIQERYKKLADYAKEKHDAKSQALKMESERVIKLIQEYAEDARSK
jgi:hypothetical protein